MGSAVPPGQGTETAVVVVFFDDMKGSTVLKGRMAAASDEQAFQMLRKEHDALLTEIITRDGGGRGAEIHGRRDPCHPPQALGGR